MCIDELCGWYVWEYDGVICVFVVEVLDGVGVLYFG